MRRKINTMYQNMMERENERILEELGIYVSPEDRKNMSDAPSKLDYNKYAQYSNFANEIENEVLEELAKT